MLHLTGIIPQQIRPTMAGAHLTPVTDPQHAALHTAATVGRVQRGGQPGQVPVGVLIALARKGYLTLTAHPGPRRSNWAYGEITGAGRGELARLNATQPDRHRSEQVVAVPRQRSGVRRRGPVRAVPRPAHRAGREDRRHTRRGLNLITHATTGTE